MDPFDPIIVMHRAQLRTLIEEAVRAVFDERENKPVVGNNGPLSVKEAAAYLNISVPTLYRYTSQRLIPHHKPNKVLYFLLEELDDWLKEHRKLTQAQIKGDDSVVVALAQKLRHCKN